MARRLTVLLCLAGLTAAAQGQPPRAPKRTPKPLVVQFDDDTVEGTLAQPDVEVTVTGSSATHAKLIRVRESFAEKVLASVNEL